MPSCGGNLTTSADFKSLRAGSGTHTIIGSTARQALILKLFPSRQCIGAQEVDSTADSRNALKHGTEQET